MSSGGEFRRCPRLPVRSDRRRADHQAVNIIDEFTRECLTIEIDRSIDADAVVTCLEKITTERPAPVHLRFDNGPEFVAHAVADWCRFNDAGTLFIDPGSPSQNAWIESFNGRLRDEHLNGQLFDSLLEAQVLTEDWRIDYNINRRHSALGRKTPAAFAEAWKTKNQKQLA
jgi:putative transposase